MPWHAVPAPSSAIDSADAFASGPGGLPWVILTVPLPVSRPRTPSAVSCSLVETMSTASAVRIACPCGWVVEDRHGVRRARVLDPNGVLRVGGVGLVHHQEPAERVGSAVRVEHGAGAAGRGVVEVQRTAGDGRVGDAARAHQPQGGGAGRRNDLDRVVEAGRAAARAGRQARAVPACRPPRRPGTASNAASRRPETRPCNARRAVRGSDPCSRRLPDGGSTRAGEQVEPSARWPRGVIRQGPPRISPAGP